MGGGFRWYSDGIQTYNADLATWADSKDKYLKAAWVARAKVQEKDENGTWTVQLKRLVRCITAGSLPRVTCCSVVGHLRLLIQWLKLQSRQFQKPTTGKPSQSPLQKPPLSKPTHIPNLKLAQEQQDDRGLDALWRRVRSCKDARQQLIADADVLKEECEVLKRKWEGAMDAAEALEGTVEDLEEKIAKLEGGAFSVRFLLQLVM